MERTWCKPLPAADLLIQGGRVVDPETGVDAVKDVLIKKGKVSETGKGLVAPEGTRVIDAAGMLVLPGFVDLHSHFRTPGREDEEDLATVSAAAAAGGYVAAFGMANTEPVTDSAVLLRGLARQAESDAVVPLGFYAAVTKGLRGEQLTEMGELGEAGAVGFSDDGRSLSNAAITRRALQYAKVGDRFVAVHAQDDSLCEGGQMHEGAASARLGLTGIPSLCESLDVARALDIAAYEDARVHVCHVSAEESLQAIARAKDAGVRVTAETTPHHLALVDEQLTSFDTNFKMNPPLRAEKDRRALVEALKSGLVDCVATDHADEHGAGAYCRAGCARGRRRRGRRPLRRRSPGGLDGPGRRAQVPLAQLALAGAGAHRQGPPDGGRRSRRLGRPCLARRSSSSRTGASSTGRLSPGPVRSAASSCSTRAWPATRRSPPTRRTAASSSPTRSR